MVRKGYCYLIGNIKPRGNNHPIFGFSEYQRHDRVWQAFQFHRFII
jgi:hypothetical protein